jgi:hypothetical protein
VLCPSGERVVAVEVKGTLRARYWPRLSRRELVQKSGAWIDKTDNPGMANWDLRSHDVYGAAVLGNFAAMAYRAAITDDFSHLQLVRSLDQLADGWVSSNAQLIQTSNLALPRGEAANCDRLDHRTRRLSMYRLAPNDCRLRGSGAGAGKATTWSTARTGNCSRDQRRPPAGEPASRLTDELSTSTSMGS